MLFGAIADDITGGTDLASLLKRAGLNVVQTLGVPATATLPADAAIVSLKTRTAPVTAAVAAARRAADWLTGAGAQRLFFKYCSTFDSTDDGNIGPVLEALLDQFGLRFTVACPAYPELGRTVYRGHLFVHDQLLSESSMRHHPLTPMTDANLVRVLGRQCRSPVALVPFPVVEAGVSAVRAVFDDLAETGHRAAIVDALTDRHLDAIARAASALRLVTGGAAMGAALARASGGVPSVIRAAPELRVHAPVALLSGSCSTATLAQVRAVVGSVPARLVDPLRIDANGQELARLEAWVRGHASKHGMLLYSTAGPDDVKSAQARLGAAKVAALVESAFQHLAKILANCGVRTFVVAGGETAGAVLQALDIRAFGFADEIEPGVPWTYSLEPRGFAMALKSGNFGSPDFFLRALARAS
jgi:uncharacterized protein YgbK (DUF1537 family)